MNISAETHRAAMHRCQQMLPEALMSTHGRYIIVAFRDRTGTDTFNDVCGIYDVFGKVLKLWQATTDPGRGPRFGKGRIATNSKGVIRLRPGLHTAVYAYGYHHGRDDHPCMDQVGDIPGERFQPAAGEWLPTLPENRGCNIHRARKGGTSRLVGDYSHGCIVFASHKEHWAFLLELGYPLHGLDGAPAYVRTKRFSLFLEDWTPVRSTRDLAV